MCELFVNKFGPKLIDSMYIVLPHAVIDILVGIVETAMVPSIRFERR